MSPVLATQQTCYHCGTTCNKTILLDDKPFCCEGCQAVYQILNDNQLCQYYNLTAAPGQSPKISRFSFLDHPDIVAQLIDFSDGNQSNVTFYVPTIHCSSCLYLLEHLYRLHPGVRRSRVDFLKKHVHVTFQPADLSLRQLAELLTSLGYEPLISLNDVVQEQQKPSYKPRLYKLAVAGFCAGNIMLFSFPEYLGLDDPAFRRLFGYLNWLLATPVVFYSGWEYFESVWSALRRKMINIDLPILTGILTAYGRGIYEVLTQTGAGYFDSVSGLIFFLLIGKWFQKHTYDFLSFERDYKSYFPLAVTVLKPDGEQAVPVAQVKKGDHLRIRNGELIPADGILYHGQATIDYSFVTGESEPEYKHVGSLLYAGGKQIGETIELEVVREVSQSYLTQLWNNDTFRKGAPSRIRTFADLVGNYFTICVLTLAFLVGTYWYLNDASRAVNAFTAILIIACPCVLSLSYPFALGNGMRMLGKLRLYLKNGDVMEKLAACDTIVFDKTGTLTVSKTAPDKDENSVCEHFKKPLTDQERSMIASLANHSAHPLSRRLLTHLTDFQLFSVNNFIEIPGQGVEGVIDGQAQIRIGSRSFVGSDALANRESEDSVVHVCINHQYRGWFQFSTQYRAGIENMLAALRPDYDLQLLSGDNDAARTELQRWFPAPNQMVFNCHPQQKLDVIRALQSAGRTVLMIGDGLNDAGALRQADAGIAVTDDTIQFTPASDGILAADSLRNLAGFLTYCRFGMRLIRFSFCISLIYNCIGLSYAVTGNLSPVVAAILMPLSSATMVLIATLGMRWRGAVLMKEAN
ncbi:heavy metal translocating P-type ATPase [Larkinella rosea]|uniref:HAD family hydrolase n=1 Tax=Larkinella rosea TaxID=2025312 RepID=A0A3P1C0P2_9BACT|nr:heavy metal translocating P-type ATPase metal-binding domain-containing protein [Larkinella rosea]RRB06981.1 HAD family hydrolase [Larkinella rosea]